MKIFIHGTKASVSPFLSRESVTSNGSGIIARDWVLGNVPEPVVQGVLAERYRAGNNHIMGPDRIECSLFRYMETRLSVTGPESLNDCQVKSRLLLLLLLLQLAAAGGRSRLHVIQDEDCCLCDGVEISAGARWYVPLCFGVA